MLTKNMYFNKKNIISSLFYAKKIMLWVLKNYFRIFVIIMMLIGTITANRSFNTNSLWVYAITLVILYYVIFLWNK